MAHRPGNEPDLVGAAAGAPLAIVCGGGPLPLRIADAAVARGRPVLLLGIHGIADPAIARFPHDWIKLVELRRPRRLLQEHGCREICIIGHLTRPGLSSLSFDRDSWRIARRIAGLYLGGDDRLLSGVARLIEEEYGVRVVGAHEVAPDLLAPEGAFGALAPSERDAADIRVGLSVLASLGGYDIGQAVVVAQSRVLAVEAAEGTDDMLRRVGDLRRDGRIRLESGVGVMVKAPKPSQDRRLDLPTVGARTVELAARAGLAGLAVVAGATLVAEADRLVAAADRAKLFVVGVPELRTDR